MSGTEAKPVIVYVVNVDWYFKLHWLKRAEKALASGAEVHLVTNFTDNKLAEELSCFGFCLHAWALDRSSIAVFKNIKELIDLYRLLKFISPSLIHAITIKPNLYVGLISFLLKVPYILSVTGLGNVFSSQNWRAILVRPFIRFIFRSIKRNKLPRKIIFENNDDRNYFIANNLCGKSEAELILGAGVNTEIYYPVDELENNSPIVLFAARLLFDKGLADLVEAGRYLLKQGICFSIVVAGILDHSSLGAINPNILQEWDDEGIIEWIGTVEGDENMSALIAKSNIVVLPTHYGEGVPRILIEAASCARALIATDIPGCREIVQDGINGILVPPKQPEALAEALTHLINDPILRKKMGQHGREIVVSLFSEEKVVSETVLLYQQLIGI